MKDAISASSPSDDCQDVLKNPLPGDDSTWDRSPLGHFHQWPVELRNYALTISQLTYAAAIYWHHDLVLIHNYAWVEAGGLPSQGQVQRHSLPKTTVAVLKSILATGLPRHIHDKDVMRSDMIPRRQSSIAIGSPLLPQNDASGGAVMVQLLPQPMLAQAFNDRVDEREIHGNRDTSGRGDGSGSTMPIDQHPFFRRFAELLPSGLAILDHNARAVFVNQHFYDLTTLLGDGKNFTSWPQSIHDDDYERVMDAYREAFESRKELRTEFRAKGEPHPWRLLLLTPLGDETLQHVSLRERGGFICSIVDISSEKGAEITERNAAQAARDRKEQQERFIDMISHEIRNPLSAVLHCAEDIADAIRDKPRHEIDTDGIREAVETISLCVSHQKNIVDDVLSFSKLDASLLSLVPKPSSPSHQLAKTLKMFQHEFRKQDLAFRYTVDDTYRDAKVQIVLADMPRIGQVLINLITNAMKFTRLAKGEKRVICSVAASTTRPKSYPPNVVFFESEHTVKRMDATTSKEWGKGEEIYVMVAVKDTGIGISPEGQQRLFERFRQATPKTEEVYGGSGLGLNISRKICHLHGGEIGVSAKEGKGSTFGFFFKVRRAEQYPAGSGDGDATHALQGESRLQDQMKALGMSSPYDLERTEPFEWTPGRKASKLSGEGKYRNDQDAKDREEAAEGEKERDASHHRPRPTPQQLSGGGGGGDKLQSQALQKSDSAMQDARRPSVGLKRNGARAHVLLVEDNVINQKIVFRKLDAKGFNVTTANNGQEAVDAIKAAPPPSSGDKNAIDVILMDKEMPVLDGNAATRAIRQLERDGTVEHVPILGVTANVRGAQQEEMLSCGMDAVLSKPYRIEEMVSRLTALVPDDCLGEESSFTE